MVAGSSPKSRLLLRSSIRSNRPHAAGDQSTPELTHSTPDTKNIVSKEVRFNDLELGSLLTIEFEDTLSKEERYGSPSKYVRILPKLKQQRISISDATPSNGKKARQSPVPANAAKNYLEERKVIQKKNLVTYRKKMAAHKAAVG